MCLIFAKKNVEFLTAITLLIQSAWYHDMLPWAAGWNQTPDAAKDLAFAHGAHTRWAMGRTRCLCHLNHLQTAARNMGVILDNGLSCTPNITAVSQSCRFALYNIHRNLSFLTKDSCSNHWSSSSWTTASRSWLDSQPLRQNRCRVSRTLHHALFSI